MYARNDASLPNSRELAKPFGTLEQEGEARGSGYGGTVRSASALALGVSLLWAGVGADAQTLDATAPMDVVQSLERVRPARAVPGEIIVKFRESEGARATAAARDGGAARPLDGRGAHLGRRADLPAEHRHAAAGRLSRGGG